MKNNNIDKINFLKEKKDEYKSKIEKLNSEIEYFDKIISFFEKENQKKEEEKFKRGIKMNKHCEHKELTIVMGFQVSIECANVDCQQYIMELNKHSDDYFDLKQNSQKILKLLKEIEN